MSAIRSPSPQGGYSPSHRHSSLAGGASAASHERPGAGGGSYRNPHSRQSLGPPPASSSSSSASAAGGRQAPASPSGYRHVSLSGDRLAEARASSPNPAGGDNDYVVDLSSYGRAAPGGGGQQGGGGGGAAHRMTTYGLTPALGGRGAGAGAGAGAGGAGFGLGAGGGRPASEYIGSGSGIRRGQTPERESLFRFSHRLSQPTLLTRSYPPNRPRPSRAAQDNAVWANDLADYERTLEALTQASLDESFTAELSAIEQCECDPATTQVVRS